jgi:uncharacterized protein (TIGR00369 family)
LGSAQAAGAPPDPSRFIGRFIGEVPHHKLLGLRFRETGDGWAELELAWAPHLVAYPETGVIASGAIFSLMDTACGLSVVTRMQGYRPHATLELRCDYLRPATPHATVIGRGECYKLTRSVAFVRGIAHDGDPGHPIAHVSGSFMLSAA